MEHSVDAEDGRLRPDAIINVPGQKKLVIDSKVSLNAYQAAFEADDDDARKTHLEMHAKSMRNHVQTLGAKSYQSQFDDAPDYVVMFVPGEHFVAAALEHDRAGAHEHRRPRGVGGLGEQDRADGQAVVGLVHEDRPVLAPSRARGPPFEPVAGREAGNPSLGPAAEADGKWAFVVVSPNPAATSGDDPRRRTCGAESCLDLPPGQQVDVGAQFSHVGHDAGRLAQQEVGAFVLFLFPVLRILLILL